MSETILIKNGRLIDPAAGTERAGDIFVSGGRIAAVPEELPADTEVIDAAGKLVCPGFIDVHVHLREPGFEAAETVETGTRSCAKGGFTTIVSMPNTSPATDSPEVLQLILDKAEKAGYVRVLPSACFTRGRAGAEVSDFSALKEAGAVCFTDDGSTPAETPLMEEAMRGIAALDMVLMDHAQDPAAEKTGVMHEGLFSKRWNLPGIPWMAEYAMVQRDINLSKLTGCRVHIQHVTSGKTMDLIRQAQREGVKITCEVTPHHLLLTDADVRPENTNFKMNPPLRSAEDREKLIAGVCDGTASMLATDHAPHPAEKKALGFEKAPFGIIGSETAIGATWKVLVESGKLSVIEWVRRWTTGPAALLGLPAPSLSEGAPADLVIIDPDCEWTVKEEEIVSRSKNTPFLGWVFHARAVRTIRYNG